MALRIFSLLSSHTAATLLLCLYGRAEGVAHKTASPRLPLVPPKTGSRDYARMRIGRKWSADKWARGRCASRATLPSAVTKLTSCAGYRNGPAPADTQLGSATQTRWLHHTHCALQGLGFSGGMLLAAGWGCHTRGIEKLGLVSWMRASEFGSVPCSTQAYQGAVSKLPSRYCLGASLCAVGS